MEFLKSQLDAEKKAGEETKQSMEVCLYVCMYDLKFMYVCVYVCM